VNCSASCVAPAGYPIPTHTHRPASPSHRALHYSPSPSQCKTCSSAPLCISLSSTLRYPALFDFFCMDLQSLVISYGIIIRQFSFFLTAKITALCQQHAGKIDNNSELSTLNQKFPLSSVELLYDDNLLALHDCEDSPKIAVRKSVHLFRIYSLFTVSLAISLMT